MKPIRKLLSGVLTAAFLIESLYAPVPVFGSTTDTNQTVNESASQELSDEITENYDFYLYGSGKNIDASIDAAEELTTSEKQQLCTSLENTVALNTLSSAGLKLIKSCEGCYLKAYKATPSEKYYTIGYGHYGPDVKKGMKITKKKAIELLKKDLHFFENAVNSFADDHKLNFNQNQFDALVSFSYNVGSGWTVNKAHHMYLTMINESDNYSSYDIVSVFGLSNTAQGIVLPGLSRRRRAESMLYLGSEKKGDFKENMNYVVSYKKIPVKKSPGKTKAQVKKKGKPLYLHQGKVLKITQIKDLSEESHPYIHALWGKCEYGWVSLDYCRYYLTGEYEIFANSLSIRKSPTTDAKELGTFHKGDKVKITKIDGRWGKCQYGWISLGYCKYLHK